jgi:type IV secretory pathway VirB2 component (pilin)
MMSSDEQLLISLDGTSLAATTRWLAQLLTGSIGTTIAIIAVALTGLSMLQGRISARDAARIVLGCFILFGAPSIARSILGHQSPRPAARAEIYNAPPGFIAPPSQQNNDPYAGASVPM